MSGFFQALLMSGTGLNPGGGVDYYVSEAGTGSGLSPASPMSEADFLLVVLADFDRFYYLSDDEF